MIDANNFDDILLEIEEMKGQQLATIDDRAVAEQNFVVDRQIRRMAQ